MIVLFDENTILGIFPRSLLLRLLRQFGSDSYNLKAKHQHYLEDNGLYSSVPFCLEADWNYLREVCIHFSKLNRERLSFIAEKCI